MTTDHTDPRMEEYMITGHDPCEEYPDEGDILYEDEDYQERHSPWTTV